LDFPLSEYDNIDLKVIIELSKVMHYNCYFFK
jgi:hypothetical protein